MALLGTLLPYFDTGLRDAAGNPLANGFLQTKVAGLNTDKAIYHDAQLTAPWTNPAQLDAEGRITAFLGPGAYDITVLDASLVTQRTLLSVEDVGQTFLAQLGTFLGTPATVTSGATVTASQTCILCDSTGGPNPFILNLGVASARLLPLLIKNLGTIVVHITPNGTDTIDTVNAFYTLPAAATPNFPSIWLVPDGTNGYLIVASHKVP